MSYERGDDEGENRRCLFAVVVAGAVVPSHRCHLPAVVSAAAVVLLLINLSPLHSTSSPPPPSLTHRLPRATRTNPPSFPTAPKPCIIFLVDQKHIKS